MVDINAAPVTATGSGTTRSLADWLGPVASAVTGPVFATLALAQAYRPVTAPDAITLLGYTTAGDGGAALYKKVAAQPSHVGRFSITLLAGTVTWYEFAGAEVNLFQTGAKGDATYSSAGTDDSTAWDSAVAIAIALGIDLVVPSLTGGKMFRIASAKTVNKGIRIRGAGAVHAAGGSGAESTPLSGSWLYFSHSGIGLTFYDSTNLNAEGWRAEGLGIYRAQTAPGGGWSPSPDDYDFVLKGRTVMHDIFFLKSNKAIKADVGILQADLIKGQVFTSGIHIEFSGDVTRLSRVHWWPYWSQNANVTTYTLANTVGFSANRADGYHVQDAFAIYHKTMFLFDDSATAQGSFCTGFELTDVFSDGTGTALEINCTQATNTRGAYGNVRGLLHSANGSSPANVPAIYVHGAGAKSRVSIFGLQTTRSKGPAVRAKDFGHELNVETNYIDGWDNSGTGNYAFSADDTAVINLLNTPQFISGTLFYNTNTNGSIQLPGPTAVTTGTAVSGQTTPTVTFSTPGSLAVTYGTCVCNWRKVNDWVEFEGSMDFTPTSFTGVSGAFRISTGIPFLPASSYGVVELSNLNASWSWGSRTQVHGEVIAANALINVVGTGSGLAAASFGTSNMTVSSSHTVRFTGRFKTTV